MRNRANLRYEEVKEYFALALRNAAEEASVKGAIAALKGFDERLTGVVTLTADKDVSILKLRWILLISILSDYKSRVIRQKVRQTLEDLEIEEELGNALTQFVLKTSPDDFIEDEHVDGKKFLEEFEPLLPLLGNTGSEIVSFLLKAYQRAWHEVLYIEIPTEIVPFLNRVASFLENGDIEAVLDSLLEEVLKWHQKVLALL